MDSSPPGSSVHRTLQARILQWVALSFSRGSSPPRNRTSVSCIAGGFFIAEPAGNQSLVSRGMQVKTTWNITIHLSEWMAKIKNRDTTKWRQGCGETEPLLQWWWANKVVQPLWKTVWQFILMKLKVTIQPNNCTSEHLCLKKWKLPFSWKPIHKYS